MNAVSYPKISLVMPSYNQARYIEEAILSVLSQDYPNLEFLVYDGGSSDNSRSIIERYSKRLSYWQSEEDGGQAEALKLGFERATGDIFCWLNSDDTLLPNTLNTVAKIFAKKPKVDFLYGDRRVIDENGVDQGRHQWPCYLTSYHWALGQPMAQESCFWRSDLYRKVGGINSSLYFIMDYDLFYRMWRVGRFMKVARPLGCIRLHDQTKNSLAKDVMLEEMSKAAIEFGLRKPGFILARVLKRLDKLQLRCANWRSRGKKAYSNENSEL